MENIAMFFLTTVFYSIILGVYTTAILKKPYNHRIRKMVIIALLCLPVNINGTVFTVLGNAMSSGSIYSVFSLFQKADKDAISLVSPISQIAGNDARSLIGVSLIQEAGRDAVQIVGLNFYQKADHDSETVFGISVFQESKDKSSIFIGASGYQKGGNSVIMGCCLVGKQTAGNDSARLLMGLVGYQNSKNISETVISMALYQKAGMQNRTFAIFSELAAKER